MTDNTLNIPVTGQERIVIIGAGFGGLTLAKRLAKSNYQIVLIDRNNFHQFQPLYYQVAMAGLEPSSIVFPLRKLFQKNKNVLIRVADFQSIDTRTKRIVTSKGVCTYDKVVFAMGAKTNYYGNNSIESQAFSLKTIGESLALRNAILDDYEKALIEGDYESRQDLIDIVIVGGGPTGVELAGSLAEMKEYILPKDYHELDHKEVDIYLIQSGDRLLYGMSDNSGEKALQFLRKLGVKVLLDVRVNDIKKNSVILSDGRILQAGKVIWAAGIIANTVKGLENCTICKGNRIEVDSRCEVKGEKDVFIVGDLAMVKSEDYPDGHPQVAQVAIQQGVYLAKQFRKPSKKTFQYKDKGSMATIGRNKAVVDLPGFKFSGFFAWSIWLFIHLAALIGARNKVIVFVNWLWNYITYDQSLRLIIRADKRKKEVAQEEIIDTGM